MEYIYEKCNLNNELVEYIENNIFPIYNLNEQGHGISHILKVINHAFDICKNYNININILYTCVSYHDIGHHIDAKNHEKISANIMIEDSNLYSFFNNSEINIIKEAIEDHRASSGIEPRNIYGKILAAADKNLTIEDAIIRTYLYSKKHTPNLSTSQIYDRIFEHLNEKFGENGYAKVYIRDEQFENFKKELISLLKDKNKFYLKITETLKKLEC